LILVVALCLIVATAALWFWRGHAQKLTRRFFVLLGVILGTALFLVIFLPNGVEWIDLLIYVLSVGSFAAFLLLVSYALPDAFIRARDVKDPEKVLAKKRANYKKMSKSLLYRFHVDFYPKIPKEKEIQLLQKAINYDPENHEAHFLLAKTYLRVSEPDQALQEIDIATGLAPDIEEYRVLREQLF
jgi:tetratricopeptide (TPR) repeat protein